MEVGGDVLGSKAWYCRGVQSSCFVQEEGKIGFRERYQSESWYLKEKRCLLSSTLSCNRGLTRGLKWHRVCGWRETRLWAFQMVGLDFSVMSYWEHNFGSRGIPGATPVSLGSQLGGISMWHFFKLVEGSLEVSCSRACLITEGKAVGKVPSMIVISIGQEPISLLAVEAFLVFSSKSLYVVGDLTVKKKFQ